MSANSLDQRVADLEQEVETLKQSLATGGSVKNWRRTFGMFEGDRVMEEIDKRTMKVRDDDRRKARQRKAKRKAVT